MIDQAFVCAYRTLSGMLAPYLFPKVCMTGGALDFYRASSPNYAFRECDTMTVERNGCSAFIPDIGRTLPAAAPDTDNLSEKVRL